MNQKEIKAEIRAVKREMKEKGIARRSFMNGGHTPDSSRLNGLLFSLKCQLEKAPA